MIAPINKSDYFFDTLHLLKEARSLGIKSSVLSAAGNTIEFFYQGEFRYIIGGRFGRLPYFGYNFCNRKDYTYRILGRYNLPIPKHIVVSSSNEAIENYSKIDFPCTVKVVSGTGGFGVYTDINSSSRLQQSVRSAFKYGSRLLIEENIRGEDYRILATPKKVVHAVRRIPAHVIGDGKSTVEQLVSRENKKPNRGPRFKQQLVEIKLDKESKYALFQQKLNIRSIPKKDLKVYLKTCCNQCKGGEVEAVTDKVHPEYVKIAIEAVKALKVPLGGVDIITTDISENLKTSRGKIIEINENPGLLIHKYPSIGEGMEVYRFVLETLFQRKLK